MSNTDQQNKQDMNRLPKCHAKRFVTRTIETPNLVFRQHKSDFPNSRIARINIGDLADQIPCYTVGAFLPKINVPRACYGKVVVIPLRDDAKEDRCEVVVTCPTCGKDFRGRLEVQKVSPIPDLNPDITPEELLPIGNMIVKVKFRKGENVDAIATDPVTGATMRPSRDWNTVLGQKLELGKEYEVVVSVEEDGRHIATPINTLGNLKSTSVALALATKLGNVTEWHETHVISDRGQWVHMLTALGINPSKLKMVTKEEVKKAFHRKSTIFSSDKKESSTLVNRSAMLELYKSLQQLINAAKDHAYAYIDKRDSAAAEVVPQQKAPRVKGKKAPVTVKVVRAPIAKPEQAQASTAEASTQVNPEVSKAVEAEAPAPVETAELPETATESAPAEEVAVAETAPIEVNSVEVIEEPVSAKPSDTEVDKLAACLANMTPEIFKEKSNGYKKIYRQQARTSLAPKGSGPSTGKKRSEKPKNAPQKGLEALAGLKLEK